MKTWRTILRALVALALATIVVIYGSALVGEFVEAHIQRSNGG